MNAQALIRELEFGLQHANELMLNADCEPQCRPSQAFGSLRYTVQRLVRELRMDEQAAKRADDDDETVNLDADLPDLARSFTCGLQISDDAAYAMPGVK